MKKLIIIAGPSGSGKTTVSDYLLSAYNIPRVLTHTTRPKRPDEQEGVDYYFETEASFQKLHFFEQVTYGGYHYGSSQEALKRAWGKHDVVSLIVDTAGAKTYYKKLGDQILLIYLRVSQVEILKQRLIARGDSPVQVKKRVTSPEFVRDLKLPKDLSAVAHIITNDDFKTTQKNLKMLLKTVI